MIYTVSDACHGMRLDAFLSKGGELSRSAAARLCQEGGVFLSGRAVTDKNARVRAGECYEVVLPEPIPTAAMPEDIPLDVVYEDSDIIVVNKPKGMVVHPAAGNPTGTLVNALLYRCKDLSGVGGELRPGIVHRIDKDTAGLLVCAKNDDAHRALAASLERHDVRRVYHALVRGGFAADTGTVDLPIGRCPTDRKKMAVMTGKHGEGTARRAVTHYTVLERFGEITYLALALETGRTHQIRVHMSYKGHPLLGDTVYGGMTTRFEKTHAKHLEGQCLFAKELSFRHPKTGEEMHFEVPLPDDFQFLLRVLREER